MKIGLFFGSFNPMHIGHLVIASYMANYTELDKVWIVVSPHNPLKEQADLIHAHDRLEMAKLATEDSEKIEVSDVELKLPKPSYTIDTLTYLSEKYPHHEFCLIMGADNLKSIKKWKNYETLLKYYKIFVYPRPGVDLSEWIEHPSVFITNTPQMEISATFVRKSISEQKSIQYFVPEKVIDFIEKKGLYRKSN
ncbi:nicotinate (nicotinamide) nucleotide adenylyltransferase [Solitalea lacus]|uniref:nicotinate (nicotinamide) nucleotide adenylyltransferase n=1 Tax=Solitalea lacus TaxID=2911172 RepID=UPI001EDACB16|nr:nicotinate (nicotinamide) nucleotide adenylyltransferase [Solitalea lacus]UKJ07435.1 nicotinate-nucleotide adenylyltransferase [Solitalea lacus]